MRALSNCALSIASGSSTGISQDAQCSSSFVALIARSMTALSWPKCASVSGCSGTSIFHPANRCRARLMKKITYRQAGHQNHPGLRRRKSVIVTPPCRAMITSDTITTVNRAATLKIIITHIVIAWSMLSPLFCTYKHFTVGEYVAYSAGN